MTYTACLRSCEHGEALRRIITTPQVAWPERESERARGKRELAVAIYMRARSRWRAFGDFEQAN
jgi:hypothetical protein